MEQSRKEAVEAMQFNEGQPCLLGFRVLGFRGLGITRALGLLGFRVFLALGFKALGVLGCRALGLSSFRVLTFRALGLECFWVWV